MPLLYSAKEARNLVKDKITTNMTTLGIGYVGVDDEKRLPRYPAVVVSVGPRDKQLHSTGSFAVSLRVFIWVYHAKLDIGHRERSDDDLDLATAIESLLESDMTWGDTLIHSWVESQVPGLFQPRAEKSDLVIGTRLTWVGLSQQPFSA